MLNTPRRMAKQKSAQATAARRTKRPERELVVLCIGVGSRRDEQKDTFIRPRPQKWTGLTTKKDELVQPLGNFRVRSRYFVQKRPRISYKPFNDNQGKKHYIFVRINRAINS